MLSYGLVDLLVLFGGAAVLPLALGGAARRWMVLVVAGAIALALPIGPLPATVALAWPVIVLGRMRARPTGSLPGRVHRLAVAYGAVAGAALVASCAGWRLFGVGEPIVELTVTHFTYAGVGALVMAGRNHVARPTRLTAVALAATAAAPPIVGLGFVTRAALPQIGGAVLLTIGVWGTCAVHLGRARKSSDRRTRSLFAVSGLAALAPMVLAVAWAAGQHYAVPALSIPDMERLHGLANAFGFVLCGLLAQHLDPRPRGVALPVAAPSVGAWW